MATASVFGQSLVGQYGPTAARRVDWDTDTIRASLHGAGYTANIDTDDFWSDAIAEASGTGYAAGGVALTTSAVTLDAGTDTVRLDATDAQWTGATITATQAVVYKDTGTAASSPLLVHVAFGGSQSVTSGTFTIQWDASGIIVLDYT